MNPQPLLSNRIITMQIEIREATGNAGWYVDHICKTDAEYLFLAKALSDTPTSQKWLYPQVNTITVLILNTRK